MASFLTLADDDLGTANLNSSVLNNSWKVMYLRNHFHLIGFFSGLDRR